MDINQKIAQKRKEYVELLKASVEKVKRELCHRSDIKRVSLFGSYAQGRADLFTDLDILIVMDSDKSFIDRLREIYASLSLPVAADIICYTVEEFDQMKQRGFLKQVLAQEVVLYEKKSY